MSVNIPNLKRYVVPNPKLRCFACLSLGRDLKPLKEQKLMAMFCPEMYWNASVTLHYMICWECEAMVLKIKRFKAKILKAKASFINQAKGDSSQVLESLSALKTTEVEVVTISPYVKPQPQPTLVTPPMVTPPMVTFPKPIVMVPIKVEEGIPVAKVKLEKEENHNENENICDFDELIKPTTIAHASVVSDESTDTASETDSINITHYGEPLFPKPQRTPMPYLFLKKPPIILNRSQNMNIPKTIRDIRMTPNAKLNYNPNPQVLINNPTQAFLTPRGVQEKVTVTGSVMDIVKDKKVSMKVKDKRVLLAAKQKKDSYTVRRNRFANSVKDNPPTEKDIGLPNLDGIIDNHVFPLGTFGIENENAKHVKCKIMNRAEVIKYMDSKRKELGFLGRSHTCWRCVERFSKKETLILHNKKHERSNGEFLCDICQQTFSEKSVRDTHYKAHFIVYECMSCRFRSQNRIRIAEHVRHRHTEAKFECSKCTAVFKTHKDIRCHRRKVHMKKPSCEECGKSFSSASSYKIHLTTHTGETRECPKCKKQVPKAAYFRHTNLHKAPFEKPEDIPCYCTVCEIVYKNKPAYEKHLKTSLKHNSVEQLGFKCDLCEKKFALNLSLKDHIETEHTDTKYTCDICKKDIKSKRKLVRHIQYTHEGKRRLSVKICDICGKSFTNKITLIEHMNAHLGKRPHKCKDCGDTFSYNAALFTHRRLVHKVKRKSDIEKDEEKCDGQMVTDDEEKSLEMSDFQLITCENKK